jgi:sugar O-acyltransferase (sialic acid O-acetyltransferase NeuD family)
LSSTEDAVKQLVIVGAGGHARVVADLVRVAGVFEIAAFVDELAQQRDGDMYLGARVFAGPTGLERARKTGLAYALPAFGDNMARIGACERIRANGYELVSAVHPSAVVASDVAFGAGTVIAAGAVVGPAARIGEACIVNTAATVDHDCVLGEGVHLEPGAHLGGNVRVGVATTIGIGAVVGKRHNVGAHAHVGAGAVVVRDIADGVVAWGVPACVVRENRR